MAKTLWDFSMLVWPSVTGKLLFWYSKQVRFESRTMRTRVLIGWQEIIDSNFYITDGLCEDMDAQNPIDFFNRFFRKKCVKIQLKGPDINAQYSGNFFLCNKPVIQQYIMELCK